MRLDEALQSSGRRVARQDLPDLWWVAVHRSARAPYCVDVIQGLSIIRAQGDCNTVEEITRYAAHYGLALDDENWTAY